MLNLLILACGEGKRNAAFTFDNAIPKCLTSAGSKTIIESIIDSYSGYGIKNVYVACLAKHQKQISDVLHFKCYEYVKYIVVDPQPTAMQSLQAALNIIKPTVNLTENDWFINWSDCYAKMPRHIPTVTTIFTDSEYRHRNIAFMTDKGINVVSTKSGSLSGNVPGIFYVPGEHLSIAADAEPLTEDFDKWLAMFDDVVVSKLSKVYDFGDYDKFTRNLRKYYSDHQSRYFNEVKVLGDTVTKRPLDVYGRKLHMIEIKYYKSVADKVPSFAKLLSYDRDEMQMTLERIKGGTCQSVIDACNTASAKQSKAAKLLKAFNEAIAPIHALSYPEVTHEQYIEAIDKEFYKAVLSRTEPVLSLINTVIEQNDIKSIDGMPITRDYNKLLEAIHTFVFETDFHVGMTHGDPNTDNCLLNKQGGIKFIDPRGYFGTFTTLGLGIKEYDFAKFVYGMTGYSRFNRAPFIATTIEDNNITTYVGVTESQGIVDVDIFKLDIDDKIRVLVGIIWVKLASYIINDPERSVLAYLYGNALLTKVLNIK